MAGTDEEIFMGGRSVSTDAPPSQDQIAKAITSSRSSGKVMKVLYLDDKGDSVGEWASSQVPENPFDGQMQGLQEPPFRLEQLLYLAESHPVHSAAIEQKTADITGQGWVWDPNEEGQSNDEGKDALEEWFQSLAPDETDMHEIIHSAWLDHETVGWGLIEVARDPSDIVQRLYHVPAHTVRAHRDGFRLCQVRDARKVWFRRWGCPDVNGERVVVDAKTGSKNPKAIKFPANDLLVIKKPSRRSSWYGIPGYISAVGFITLALAARDDNLFWFANRREPRWAIVLSNLADDPNLEEDLRRAFVVDMKQPYRNLMIPIQGPGKVEFNKLSDTKTDGSFAVLAERADKAIMIAHRVPGERLANSQVGPLGGNSTLAASRIYKDGVVAPGQELLNKRLNRFIKVEYPKTQGGVDPKWKLVMEDLDVDDDRQDLDMTVIAFHGNLINLGEARKKIGMGPLMKKVKQPDEQTVDPATGLPQLSPQERADAEHARATAQAEADAQARAEAAAGAATGPAGPTAKALPGQVVAAPPVPGEAPVIPTYTPPDPNAEEEVVETESEYNDMLFTEIPGAAGTVSNPAVAPSGAGGLKLSRTPGNAMTELASLEKAVRVLYASAKEGHDDLQRLTADLRDAVEEQRGQ